MIRKKIRIARITHQCIECYGDINPKSKYLEISGEDGFYYWTIRKHINCNAIKEDKHD